MYRVVKIDESHAVCDPTLLDRCGGKLYCVYMYNDQEVTHLCEITPSYWLQEVDVIPESYPEDGRESEKLWEDLLECRNEEYGIYVHCYQVDAMKSEEWGEYDSIESAAEDYSANPLY